ncbi:MAG: hypothetical protein LBC71_02925 [Oscillospiraceae bacterium]|nr:hypothetical protein [Oscillospiraceae bacterium]
MEEMIINVSSLPERLNHFFRSDRVSVREDKGSIILTPISNKETTNLWGLLPYNKFTTTEFLAQKKLDKDLES